jgi:hypothetical protein
MSPFDAVDGALLDLTDELRRAQDRFAPFHSPHEGLAVIHEEYVELQSHVYGNTGASGEARDEALQIAAMALRYVIDLCPAPA